MPDALCNLVGIMAERPAGCVVGWRDGQAVCAGEFVARVVAWRTLLARTGGQDFALFLADGIEFGAALLGAWQAGKTVWLAADALPATLRELAQSVDGWLGELPGGQVPAIADGVSCAASHDSPDARLTALVIHTSGTTGAAQAVPKRLDQLSCEIATLEKLFGATLGAAEIVATVSHQHLYGLLFKVLWPLTAGRAIHALSAYFPEQLAPVLAARDGVLVASPAHLKRLPAHPDWAAAARRLRAIFSSGGPLPEEVAQATGTLLGQMPIEVYGSSETGGIAWRQRSKDADDSWQPMTGLDWRIGATDGLLEVRSPHLPDDRWLRLADHAQAAGPGRFLLAGRADRLVKIEEKRISLDAIETLLCASALVAEARVAVCDTVASQRQRLAAFVVLSPCGQQQLAALGRRQLNQQLRALLVDAVQPVALPRRWRYPAALPVDAQGKTTRAQLLGLLALPDLQAPPELPRRLPQWQLVDCALHELPQRVAITLSAPADLLYFDGHFPDVKILPGVVQVDWAIHFGRAHFVLPACFLTMHALKFQRVIGADQPVTLELLHDARQHSLAFRYFSVAGQHASGRLLFVDGKGADV